MEKKVSACRLWLCRAVLAAWAVLCCTGVSAQDAFNQARPQLDSLQELRLPRSIMTLCDNIMTQSAKQGDWPSYVLAWSQQICASADISSEAEDYAALAAGVQQRAATLPGRIRPFADLMLADIYVSYGASYGWQIGQRTETVGTAAETPDADMLLWTSETLYREIRELYARALAGIGDLADQDASSDKWAALWLPGGKDPSWQPALYEAVAIHILDFCRDRMSNEDLEPLLPSILLDGPAFAEVEWPEQTDPTVRLLLGTLQGLTLRHADDPSSLARIGLLRAQYAIQPVIPTGTPSSRYISYLRRLFQSCRGTAAAPSVLYELSYACRKQSVQSELGVLDTLLMLFPQDPLAGGARVRRDEDLYECTLFMDLEAGSTQTGLSRIPDEPIKAHLNYRNTDSLFLAVYRLPSQLCRQLEIRWDEDDLERFLQGTAPVRSWRQTLPTGEVGTYRQAAFKIDGLPAGHYLLAYSNAPIRQTDYAFRCIRVLSLRVSPISMITKREDGVLRIYVTDRKTGRPLKGARVDLHAVTNGGREAHARQYETDADGMVTVIAPAVRQAQRMVADVSYRGDTLYNYDFYVYRPATGRTQERPTYEVQLYTDRSIYRPGQQVQFSGIAVMHDMARKIHQTAEKRAMTVRLESPDGELLDTVHCTTDALGAFGGAFDLPSRGTTGMFSLSCSDGGYISFAVEEYKRPTFAVQFDEVTAMYRYGDEVRVKGLAQTYAGYAADGATVAYEVVRRTERPFFAFSGLRRIGPVYHDSEVILKQDTCVTDEAGFFDIAFTAVPPDTDPGNRISVYHVRATVTDRAGETHTETTFVRIGNRPLYLTANWPELLLPGQEPAVSIGTVNAQQAFVPADLDVTVYALTPPRQLVYEDIYYLPHEIPIPKAEHERYFPWLSAGETAAPEHLATGRSVLRWHGASDSTMQVSLPQLSRLKDGWYKVCVAASAGSAQAADTLYFRVVAETPSTPIAFIEDWFTPVRTEAVPGESFEFQIAGGEKNSYVLYEYIGQDGRQTQVIETGQVPLTVRIPATAQSDGAAVRFTLMQQNRVYTREQTLSLRQPSRELQVDLATFRDKMQPGEEEQWTVTVRDAAGQPVTSGLMVTMYDASLDALYPFHWNTYLSIPRVTSFVPAWQMVSWRLSLPTIPNRFNPRFPAYPPRLLNYNLLSCLPERRIMFKSSRTALYVGAAARSADAMVTLTANEGVLAGAVNMMMDAAVQEEAVYAAPVPAPMAAAGGTADEEEVGEADQAGQAGYLRTRFNETAFFFPKLTTGADGNLSFSFTMPDALTEWRMVGFAHTQDLKYGTITRKVVTQKPVAVQAQAPRLLRGGDTLRFVARIYNTVGNPLEGTAVLSIRDALTDEPVACLLTPQGLQASVRMSVQTAPGRSETAAWQIVVPDRATAVKYRLEFLTDGYTDGEENVLPVLSDRTLVTETLPMSLSAGTTRTFTLDRLVEQQTHPSSVESYRLTFEMTPQPVWYAVQALPYLMETDTKNVEQLYTRLFANSVATLLARQTPRIREVFDQWQKKAEADGGWQSKLAADEQLKQILLEETPWVMEARSEAEQQARMGVLFDVQRMAGEQKQALRLLREAQMPSGGFGWFTGSNFPDLNMTLHVASGMEQLLRMETLGEGNRTETRRMLDRAYDFLDERFTGLYEEWLRHKPSKDDYQPSFRELQYLYVLSAAGRKTADMTDAARFYLQQATRYWTRYGAYAQGMLALTLHRTGDTVTARKIVRSLSERAVRRQADYGVYWPELKQGRLWSEDPIAAAALLVEMYHEVTQDEAMVEEIQTWLLRQKQTHSWETTRATAAACYALMARGKILGDADALPILIENGEERPAPAGAAGTGYFQIVREGDEIQPEMGRVTVKNPSGHLMWGALYWQYFANSTDVRAAVGGLQVERRYFRVRRTTAGEVMEPVSADTPLHVGDLVRVRLTIRADQDMEYVHLKDTRAAGMEPENVLSRYKSQEGLYYYESTRDAASHFFVSEMKRGTYVFEYDLRATHQGRFSTGLATLQCYYAPEFNAHSDGLLIEIR
ncbi:MAG: hypothetical protein IKI72_08575 [Bacteroidales bacterium]|nr:hypothetical protein [Bacteroidales bacterium]